MSVKKEGWAMKRVRKLLDLYDLFSKKMGGLYKIREIPYKAVLYSEEWNQKDFDMTDDEYKFYLACRHALLCLPEEIREKMREIIAR